MIFHQVLQNMIDFGVIKYFLKVKVKYTDIQSETNIIKSIGLQHLLTNACYRIDCVGSITQEAYHFITVMVKGQIFSMYGLTREYNFLFYF